MSSKIIDEENCKIGAKCFSTLTGKHLYQSVLFNKYSCSIQFKLAYQKSRNRDSGPSFWNASPETQDLGTKVEHGTQDVYLGPRVWDPPPGTGNPKFGNRDSIPLREMRDPYLGTFTLIQLSLNVLVAFPSCFKQIASQICTTWQRDIVRN